MFKPEPSEFAPYYSNYLSLVPEGDFRAAFASQPGELRGLLADIAEERGTYRYEDGKWSIKELLSHIIDGERIFSYRMLRISRDDATPLSTFDQEHSGYTKFSHANERSFDDLLREFEYLRLANSLMLKSMDEADLKRMGTASDNPVSVRAIAGILYGHVQHHMNVIRSRYLT